MPVKFDPYAKSRQHCGVASLYELADEKDRCDAAMVTSVFDMIGEDLEEIPLRRESEHLSRGLSPIALATGEGAIK